LVAWILDTPQADCTRLAKDLAELDSFPSPSRDLVRFVHVLIIEFICTTRRQRMINWFRYATDSR
jgi:hypothetical protein